MNNITKKCTTCNGTGYTTADVHYPNNIICKDCGGKGCHRLKDEQIELYIESLKVQVEYYRNELASVKKEYYDLLQRK